MATKKIKQRKQAHPLQETLGVRLSGQQRNRLRQARDVVSARKGEPVEESVLARDFIMRGVDETLAPAEVAP